MNLNFTIDLKKLEKLNKFIQQKIKPEWAVVVIALILSIAATIFTFSKDYIVAYGDAESHLNIAKRVISNLTPGAAQLGGIWLPIPHILLIPFVWFDYLWRTGLAGSIVSGFAYIISSLFLYKTAQFLTKSKVVGFITFLVFALNPNILYMQSTPMTELVLTMFFILSTYYFIRYAHDRENISNLIVAGFFGFCASLSRYDGWFLVLFEAFAIIMLYIRDKNKWKELEGKLILFCTIAFFGIALWMLWDLAILGDPFFFTNSEFSAKSQQQVWLSHGELPAYHNIFLAFLYYFVTSMASSGILIYFAAVIGLGMFLKKNEYKHAFIASLILLVPFIFNVVTLFLGQSVIFIPHLTPTTFEWTLFNTRYGVMVMPAVAFFFAYLVYKKPLWIKALILGIFLIQYGFFFVGYSSVISFADGTTGLSRAKRPDAEQWLHKNYDDGLVLLDDYSRTVSILRSNIPMQNTIYIGNRIYWEESFYFPEKYAKWIVMQKDDEVWKNLYANKQMQGRLFKYFNKAYTSPEILIFKRNPAVPSVFDLAK